MWSFLNLSLMVEAARVAVRFDPHWQITYNRLKQRRGSNVAVVAVARKLLVVIWHLLHKSEHYHYRRDQTFVTKLQEWARTIGKAHWQVASSREFVEQQLHQLGLSHIVDALISSKKGKLMVQFRNAHQT